MSNSEDIRYPQSAELFRFCKEALALRGDTGQRVIDQQVGSILGFDPADCSHWKRGKKNIRSVNTIQTIARHLDADARLLSDIVMGRSGWDSSLMEYRGQGRLRVSIQYQDEVKKNLHQSPPRLLHNPGARSLEQALDTNREEIRQLTLQILRAADIRTCPVFLPELSQGDALRGLELRHSTERRTKPFQVEISPEGRPVLWCDFDDKRVGVRFLTAQEIGRLMLFGPNGDISDDFVEVRCTLFALHLLMPEPFLLNVVKDLEQSRDLVQELSQTFWVGRGLVNLRLQDHIAHTPAKP